MPKCLLVLFLVLTSFSLKAQTWEFGAGVGGAGYMGDLNPNNPLAVSGPSASLFARYNFDGYFSARLGYSAGIISANDANSSNAQFRARNLSFKTDLYEVSAYGELNFLNYIPSVSKSPFTPYLYLGVAAVNYY